MTGLFTTVVELVKLGSLGVIAVALLLGFLLAFQSKPVDPTTAKLRTDFLRFAFGSAVVVAVMGLVPLFLNRGGPMSERLFFSPDFNSEKLTPPTIELPDGTQWKHDARFDLQPSAGTQVVTISMDATLNEVRNLKQASEKITSALSTVTKQRDTLATKAASVKTTADAQPKVPALQSLQLNSANVDAIWTDFAKSVKSGDYARANQLSGRFQTSAMAAEPAVAVIAGQKPPLNQH